jgi:hypothetical protein
MTEPSGLWEQLKQRRVLRVVGIYLAASWLLLQLADILGDIWELSSDTQQGFFLLLVAALPVVTVLAWIYDVSDGRIVETRGAGLRELVKARGAAARIGFSLSIMLFIGLVTFGLLHLWPDENLDSRVRHLLAADAFSRDSPENLAYGLYGFGAPSGEDPFTHGRFVTSAYETLGIIPSNVTPLSFTVGMPDFYPLRGGGSLEDHLRGLDGFPAVLEANAEMMDRYEALKRHSSFSAVIRPTIDSPLAFSTDFLVGQLLTLRAALLAAEDGDSGEAWDIVNAELDFHRAFLASADNIVSKMIASVMVEEDVRMRLALIARGHDLGAGSPIQRLSLAERSMVTAIRFEALGTLNSIHDAEDRAALAQGFEDPSDRLLFQILPYRQRATTNKLILPMLELAEASLMETPELIAWAETWDPPGPEFVDRLNNGAGSMMLHQDFRNWVQYSLRVHDLDRLILLAEIAERMLGEGISPSAASTWLLSLGPEYNDPFTGERPVWSDSVLRYPVENFDRRTEPALPLPLDYSVRSTDTQ